MTYHLGVDLGTTFSSAAVEQDGQVEVAVLGNRSTSVPSVLFLKDDDTVLVGEAAERRGASEPSRLAREFKRRVGDPVPILLAGTPYGADALMGRTLQWIVQRVAEIRGGPAAAVVLTHPANWGRYKIDMLEQAARHVGVPITRMISEPEAAATAYAHQSRLAPGATVAVYDLGGGTFDAAILRRGPDVANGATFELVGQPDGMERLGGIDLDHAVFAFVRNALGAQIDELPLDDPAALAALARLRRDCVDAKEALSADTDTWVPVTLPNVQTEVRITRAEFETLIRPALGETIAALERTLRSAGLGAADLDAVLLVGGSSRIPLVAELIGAELGRPVAVDANPKDLVARGAAWSAAQSSASVSAPAGVRPVPVSRPVVAPPSIALPQAPTPTLTPNPAPAAGPGTTPAAPRRARAAALVALLAFVALAGAAAATLLGGGGEDADSGPTSTTTPVDGTTSSLATTTTAPTTTTLPPTTTTTAPTYTPEIRADFVTTCAREVAADGFDEADARVQTLCTCLMDTMQNQLPFERYGEVRLSIETDADLPADVDALLQPCLDAFAASIQ